MEKEKQDRLGTKKKAYFFGSSDLHLKMSPSTFLPLNGSDPELFYHLFNH